LARIRDNEVKIVLLSLSVLLMALSSFCRQFNRESNWELVVAVELRRKRCVRGTCVDVVIVIVVRYAVEQATSNNNNRTKRICILAEWEG